jgi:SAM-dependent methyltransferase
MTNADAATGQVIASAAEVYEQFFVPALFAQWPERVLDHAGVVGGDDVLDVACGTGVVARAAADRLRGHGSVSGVDVNDAMLAVARRSAAPVTWVPGRAEALPFPDGAFDRVVCQFGLMFFTDRAADGEARFDSLDGWLHTEIRGWTLAGMISDAQFETLRTEARRDLARFVGDDGHVRFPAPALLATAKPPGRT